MEPIAELAEAHRSVVAKLRRFSFQDMAALAGGLLTMPDFQANTVRIEAFLHLAALSCVGCATASRDDLALFLGREMADSPLTPREDPPTMSSWVPQTPFPAVSGSSWGSMSLPTFGSSVFSAILSRRRK